MKAQELESALSLLAKTLASHGESAEIVLAGGAWMVLILGNRDVTQDIDAYIAPPTGVVQSAARTVAEELGLPPDWINDGVKGFFYGTPPQTIWREYPGLRVYAVTPDYLLALKVYAARITDYDDVRALIRHLGLRTADQALRIVEQYIPSSLLMAKHQYFLESCFDDDE